MKINSYVLSRAKRVKVLGNIDQSERERKLTKKKDKKRIYVCAHAKKQQL